MLQKFLLILFLAFHALSANAQEFKAGAIAGAVFSQVDGDTYIGFNKFGVVGGLYVSRWFGNNWAGQLEIVYKQKGSRHSPDESKGDYSLYKLNLNYIEVPLLAKLRIRNFMFEAGGAFGALIHSSEADQNGIYYATVPFEDYELSSLAGISYLVYPRMVVNLRWSYSLTRARKAYGGKYDWQPPPKWMDGKFGQYNQYISLSVYYEFDRIFKN